MKLKIKKKANSKIRSSYAITATFMDGDADGYGTSKIIIPTSDLEDPIKNAEFESLILTIERCNHAYQNGKGGYEGYEDVDGYEKHFGDYPYECEWDKKKKTYLMTHESGGWCDDCTSSFDGWGMVYYDELGNEFPVSVTFDKAEKESFKLVAEEVD